MVAVLAVTASLAEPAHLSVSATRAAGLSTNFLVLQAQRDLAAAQNAELRARLDYRKSLVDFELVQSAAV